jgi:mono/diheme cytochrome c family protein
MSLIVKLITAICLLGGVYALAHAESKYNEARGQMLYSTHCLTCHTSQVHWREQKKVKDWNSLVTQIRHWQGIAGLGWSDEEINDVAHYLNVMFYEYKDTAQGRAPNSFFYKDK